MLKNLLLSLLTFLVVFAVGFYFFPYLQQQLLDFGIIEEKIPIAGTGSMYPTFPKIEGVTDKEASQETVALPAMKRFNKGLELFGIKLFTQDLQRGDIIEFHNEKTFSITKEKYGEEAGFVKRVVAISGDEVELRDGYFYLNGIGQIEPYTAKARSTYGGTVVADCQKIRIPDGKVFVMGDNRKASLDSRFEIGLIDKKDIYHVLPISEQDKYRKLWRDATNDFSLANTATLDINSFLSIINIKRNQKKLIPLKLNNLLADSARIRGQAMINSNDFSLEATRSGINLKKAVAKSGYSNIILAEIFTRGYFDAQELSENLFEFANTENSILSSEYQDIGLSAVVGNIEGCPTQVVVLHFGGYVPPAYSKEEINSWKTLIDKLVEILPSWEELKESDGVDKDKLNKLLNLLNTRLNNARTVYRRLSNNEWLTDSENKMVEDDKNLNDEAVKIIEELSKS